MIKANAQLFSHKIQLLSRDVFGNNRTKPKNYYLTQDLNCIECELIINK